MDIKLQERRNDYDSCSVFNHSNSKITISDYRQKHQPETKSFQQEYTKFHLFEKKGLFFYRSWASPDRNKVEIKRTSISNLQELEVFWLTHDES